MQKKKVSAIFILALIILLSMTAVPVSAANTNPFDTVLVLDISGSMSNEIGDMRKAAVNACNDILNSNPKNQIAVVAFGSYAEIECNLTSDSSQLASAINSLSTYGTTDMYDACVLADQILKSSASVNSTKNVIIMTDGWPNEGAYSSSGRYTTMFPNLAYNSYYPDYANSVYDYVSQNLHPYANVYTSGFFYFNENDPSSLDDEEKLAVQLVKDLANAKSYFPTSANDIFVGAVDDVINNETTTKAPVTTTKPPVTTTKAPETTTKAPVTTTKAPETTTKAVQTENIILNGTDDGPGDGGSSTGLTIALGTVGTVGGGGLIALIIFLLTRKPKAPIAPIMTPVVLPISDDDDEDETDKINEFGGNYPAPNGIEAFAAGAGAVNAAAAAAASASVIYGISGTYRSSTIDIQDHETIFIGRDPLKCSLVITDDIEKVSRVHCSVSYNASAKSFVVVDLSKNGTFTKATKLPYNTPTELSSGTEIQLADSSNIFRLG